MKELIKNYINEVKSVLDKLDVNEIETFIKVLLKARDNDNTIFIMGNGGSAATASHFAGDFSKNVNYKKDKKFKIICLNDNIPVMMAYANDCGYENIFVEQLKNQFESGDVVIGLSGSGNSKNILKAIEFANQNNGITIGITGYDGGQLKKNTNYSVNTNIDDMQISEDVHLILNHLCTRVLEQIEG